MTRARADRGALVVSLDLELLWGYHDVGGGTGRPWLIEQCNGARTAVRRLLDLFDQHRVPATWATVGHLFLERAERDSRAQAHPGHPRPRYPWVKGDWFDALPQGDSTSCPGWYGHDLVEMIKAARQPQEIGCHTFSHTVFGDPGCDEVVAKAELARCVELAKADGLELKTIVFPRNKIGHLATVRDAGFEVYRGRDARPFAGLPAKWEEPATVVSRVLSIPPAPVRPYRTPEGLINLPGSMFYMPSFELQQYVPMLFRTVVAKRGLREAARQNGIFHLRLHPEAMVLGADRLFAGLDEIFDEADRLEQRGELQKLSMYDAAHAYLV